MSGSNHLAFANNLLNANLFFDTDFISPRGLTLLNYTPNFKYQYATIEEIISFAELFAQINEELTWIHEHLEELNHNIPNN